MSKKLFIKDKDLRDRWSAVSKSEWFAKVLVFARGELMESKSVGIPELTGAKAFENILLTMADEENTEDGFPTSGLVHDLDRKPRPADTPETPDKKKKKGH